MATEHVSTRHNQDQAVFRKRKNVELLGRVDGLGDDTDVAVTLGDGTNRRDVADMLRRR